MTQSIDLQAGATAFGDGTHPSTQGMLSALDALRDIRGIAQVLDMGCGSGILSLKAAWQWHAQVIAADIMSDSVAATIDNAAKNQLHSLIEAVQSDGCSHPLISQRAPYHLIMANMLAEPLVSLAFNLVQLLEPDEGLMLLSGLLRWQVEPIEDAYSRLGLRLLQRYVVGDWVTLLLQRA